LLTPFYDGFLGGFYGFLKGKNSSLLLTECGSSPCSTLIAKYTLGWFYAKSIIQVLLHKYR